jgi:hypothetical protein
MKKRGNPLYRDERVHWCKKEEIPNTEMKEFTDVKKRKSPIQRWKSSLMKKEETPNTEMKEFTDEKKRKPPIQRWKSSLMKKRGNPLYRDERVHLLYCVWIQGNLLYCVWIRGNPLHCVWITSVCSHLCQA